MSQNSCGTASLPEAGRPGGDAVTLSITPSGVAIVTLNRPERLNAWGADIAAGFYRCIDAAEADPEAKVIVVTGSGKAFCAGAHMSSLSKVGEKLEKPGEIDVSKLVGERHPYFLTRLRKPTIAAINGACAGIGLTHALMCDIRFAAAGAKFATSFPRRGLVAEYGISWILPRLVGFAPAMELMISGRTFLANEAAELNLVTCVLDPELLVEHAVNYAQDIAQQCSPTSLSIIKQQMYGDFDRDLIDASSRAERLMGESLTRTDFIEGISSFLSKRPPNFPPLASISATAQGVTET